MVSKTENISQRTPRGIQGRDGLGVRGYLWSVVRFVEFSRLARSLLYTVVLAGVPLDQRGVLGGLRSVGDAELHDHDPGPWRRHSWNAIRQDIKLGLHLTGTPQQNVISARSSGHAHPKSNIEHKKEKCTKSSKCAKDI